MTSDRAQSRAARARPHCQPSVLFRGSLLPASFLFFPLQSVRPWRTFWGRCTRIIAAVALSACFVHLDAFLRSGLVNFALMLLAFLMCLGIIRGLDAYWPHYSTGVLPSDSAISLPDAQGLHWARRPGFEYNDKSEISSVGIALSGGGYRASLFALGALLYIHDALAKTSRRVVAMSSVSGGSVTNAVVAHSGGIETRNNDEFDRAARALIDHATAAGSMFSGLRSKLYYFLFPPVAGISFLALITLGLFNISLSTYIYAGAIVMLFVCIGYINHLTSTFLYHYKKPRRFVAGLSFVVASIGVALTAPLLYVEGRQGLALLSAVATLACFSAVVWSVRGPLIELGETVYFSPDAIRLRGHTPYAADLTTARAVRASAAFPLAFPPVTLTGVPFYISPMGGSSVSFGPRLNALVLVDGGVRDNLGFSRFEEYGRSLDELIVISAAPNRYPVNPLNSFVVLELIAFLRIIFLPYDTRERLRRRMLASVFYTTPWDKKAKAAGTIFHIEDSPFDLPFRIWSSQQSMASERDRDWPNRPDYEHDQKLIADKLWQSAGDHSSRLLERATQALDHLEKVEELKLRRSPIDPFAALLARRSMAGREWARSWDPNRQAVTYFVEARDVWRERASRSAALKTTFGAFDPFDVRNLLLHGYYLACANLHLTLDWLLLDDLDTKRLEQLIGQENGRTVDAGISKQRVRVDYQPKKWTCSLGGKRTTARPLRSPGLPRTSQRKKPPENVE